MKQAVFIDRDGTINVEKEYLYLPADFEFIAGVPAAIKKLNDAGFLVIVVSNQSGVARGYYTEDDVYYLHSYVDRLLAEEGAHVDAWFFCPHHPDGRGSYALPCRCRKPHPGMLLQAAERFMIDLEASFMIGDKLIDVQAGKNAGCRSMLVRSGYGADEETSLPDGGEVYDDLAAAVVAILLQQNQN
jgi:D-glycero-D-manno-heptose 1,7-bisphosphate phosphatase